MIDVSSGRYWDLPWSLVSSCSRCSPGCQNCWSLSMEKRFHKGIEGQIETHPERLSIPLKRRKPTVYAIWNDLHHKNVPMDFRDEAYAYMVDDGMDRHTFLVLTKRPAELMKYQRYSDKRHQGTGYPPHIFHGLTVCNQHEADAKIPVFLQVPGKKVLNIDPMLGPVDLMYPKTIWPEGPRRCCDGRDCGCMGAPIEPPLLYGIDAVILGGGASPMNPNWVRKVRDDCAAAGVGFFFKGWGEYAPSPDGGLPDHLPSSSGYYFQSPNPPGKVWKFGRKTAGRLLDGKEYNDLPWVKP